MSHKFSIWKSSNNVVHSVACFENGAEFKTCVRFEKIKQKWISVVNIHGLGLLLKCTTMSVGQRTPVPGKQIQ